VTEFLYKEETFKIRGAVFEVYKTLGCGFLEAVYQESLAHEFITLDIPFIPQREIKIDYKGEMLNHTYISDFVCYDKIIIELKAVKELCDMHRAQLQNYLKAADMKIGLLVNFGHYPKVEIERIIRY